MPSKLDPHLTAIEGWLAAEPKLTALAILSRLSERAPAGFGKPQHSIVQRLLKTLRAKSTNRLIAGIGGCRRLMLKSVRRFVAT